MKALSGKPGGILQFLGMLLLFIGSVSAQARDFNSKMEATSSKRDMGGIEKLLSQDKRKQKRSSTVFKSVCGQNSDFYRHRFLFTGSISDMNCFQAAGRRELDSRVR